MERWVVMSDVKGGGASAVVSAVLKENSTFLLVMAVAAVSFIAITTSDRVFVNNISQFCVKLSEGRASFGCLKSLRKRIVPPWFC